MDLFKYKPSYRRRLPHIHPVDSAFFVTFRLAGSIAKEVVRKYKCLKEERRYQFARLERIERDASVIELARQDFEQFKRDWFIRFESLLDGMKHGPTWLAKPEIREIVAKTVHENAGSDYRLFAFCVMPNHVHLVLKPLISESDLELDREASRTTFLTPRKTLPEIMKSIKGASARKANLVLGRSGGFWEKESYDRYIRDDEHLFRAIRYTVRNPVKAGLVRDWKSWEGTYLAEDLITRVGLL